MSYFTRPLSAASSTPTAAALTPQPRTPVDDDELIPSPHPALLAPRPKPTVRFNPRITFHVVPETHLPVPGPGPVRASAAINPMHPPARSLRPTHAVRHLPDPDITAPQSKTSAPRRCAPRDETTTGFTLEGFYPSWSAYPGREFPPAKIPARSLTHLLYAFATVRIDGTVILADSWVGSDKPFSPSATGAPPERAMLRGCLGEVWRLKQSAHPTLKSQLVIGGWTHTPHMARVAADATDEIRSRFIVSAIGLVEHYGLDGLDLCWEFPTTPEQGRQLLALLRDLRLGLNTLAAANSAFPYRLTCALPPRPGLLRILPLRDMAVVVDAFHLHAWDFHGPWDRRCGYLSNLYSAAPGEWSISALVSLLQNEYSVPLGKMVLGLPLYGRSYTDVSLNHRAKFLAANSASDAPLDLSLMRHMGPGGGTHEPGVYDLRSIPTSASTRILTDSTRIASYCHDLATRELVVYDTDEVIAAKVRWAHGIGLAGVCFWELCADRPSDSAAGSIVDLAYDQVQEAHKQAPFRVNPTDSAHSHTHFPRSRYANVATQTPT